MGKKSEKDARRAAQAELKNAPVHLLGTTDSPTPKWRPKKGELVAVRHSPIEEWKVRVFRYHDNHSGFACDNERERASICFWDYCEPLRAHFTIPEE